MLSVFVSLSLCPGESRVVSSRVESCRVVLCRVTQKAQGVLAFVSARWVSDVGNTISW